MDLLEGKLERLRELRALQCCRHIDYEIKSWLNNIEQPLLQPPPPELIATTTIATTTPPNVDENFTTATAVDSATTQITTTDPATQSTESSLSIFTPPSTTVDAHNTTTPSPPPTPASTLPPPLKETEAETLAPKHLAKPLKTYLTKEEIEAHDAKTIGCFLANLKHLESLDSDATESTSSNDSYDELEGFSHGEIPPKKMTQQPYMKSHHPSSSVSMQRQQRVSTSSLTHLNHSNLLSQRRASHQHSLVDGVAHSSSAAADGSLAYMSDLKQKSIWKWATERSRLASKWTWLQAQIADLEFRVRGQNDSLMQAKARKVQPIPQVLPENFCSRTYPLNKDFRQRRLIKSSQILSDSSKSSVKFSHVPCVCSSLPQTIAPCLSCKGRYNYLKQSEGENAPLLERASLLDPGCHPVLSFPDDITLGSQLSYLLRQETVIRKPTKGKPGRKKGSTSASSANVAINDDKSGNKHVSKKGKYYQTMSNRQAGHAQAGLHLKNPSQTMIASNKLKRKYRKHSNNSNYTDPNNSWFNGSYHPHSNNSTKRNKRIRSASSMNESSLHSDSSNPYRPNHFTNNNMARSVTRRRRSEQSAYDIDNIVIPFSVAATTRVEILEYKEIMTPSWRVWENGNCLNDINNVTSEPPEEDVEDTSDEAYIQRHTKGEHEEKKRFSLKPPPKNESHSAVPRE